LPSPTAEPTQDLVQLLGHVGREDQRTVVGDQHRVLDADVELLVREFDDRLNRDDHARLEGQIVVTHVVDAHAYEVAGAAWVLVGEAPPLEDLLGDRLCLLPGHPGLHRCDYGFFRLQDASIRPLLELGEPA
jgi:hypothetical protein